MDKVFYNEASANKLGWDPTWFGVYEHGEELVKAIRSFQREHGGLTADGLCGPNTFRRIWLQREAKLENYIPESVGDNPESFIIFNNNYIPIEWPKVVLPFMKGGMRHTSGFKKVVGKRKIDTFVTHWDVCLNSKSCFNVLNRRGISIHFTIDNDGTIRQHLDCNHIAWHAGSSKWNSKSIGVEISNAFYEKYQKTYISRGHGERPIVEDAIVHGKKLQRHLGFYPVQIEALKALYKAIHEGVGVPLKAPESGDSDFKTLTTVSKSAAAGRFKGFLSHYHLTKRKIDCANLDIVSILEEIKDENG